MPVRSMLKDAPKVVLLYNLPMSYFLSAENLEANKQFEISGDEARHILFARRIKVGEKIVLQGPDENRFLADVVSFTKKSIIVKAIESVEAPKEPEVKIVLFQSLISENALDSILQKSTELGVAQIVLFNSRNTPTHLADKVEAKLNRWKKILQEAAKQSNRLRTPVISFIEKLPGVLVEAENLDKVFLLEKTADKTFQNSKDDKYKSIGILVGPEGAFTVEELESFSSLKNLQKIRLGPRVLRADTAAISAAAIVQSLWGDM